MKDNIQRMKRQASAWERIALVHTGHNELRSSIFQELLQTDRNLHRLKPIEY